jgi:hypothetical protein
LLFLPKTPTTTLLFNGCLVVSLLLVAMLFLRFTQVFLAALHAALQVHITTSATTLKNCSRDPGKAATTATSQAKA